MNIGELLSPPMPPQEDHAHALRVAIAVVVKGTDVLVVRRRGEIGIDKAWQFPAGMVKPGATSEAVAVRETLGETDVHCVVRDALGSRLHPITNVLCDYVLCDYVAGVAKNLDVFENVDVTWISKTELAGLIPADHIYQPVLDALELSNV
jgi:8-oxo-dGTP pyrophosphatase MutT (NUDIX family)